MLEEFELHKQEIIKADHVIDFVNVEYEHEPQEKLQESKPASEAVPYGDHTDAQYHKYTERDECPSDRPGTIKELLRSRSDDLLRFLRCGRKQSLILNKSYRR